MAVADPSMGIDAQTGLTIKGWDHLVQSLRDIFLTSFGARWHREWFGSFVPAALGRNITRDDLVPLIIAITSAIEQWEPRARVSGIEIGGALRDGRLLLDLTIAYRPRALLGDFTEEGERRLALAVSREALTLE